MNRIPLFLMIAFLLSLCVQCSRNTIDVTGGSTSTNNARLSGMVVNKNGMAGIGVSIALKDMVVTPKGDTIQSEFHATAGEDGSFTFASVLKGKYVLVAGNPGLSDANYQTRCEVQTDTIVRLTLSKPYVLKGRILADSSVTVQNIFVAPVGITRPVHPDGQGFYSVAGVPGGMYDIAFIHGSVADYLPLQVLSCPSCQSDTIYVRDVLFTNSNTTPYSYYATTLPATFAVQPVVYSPGSEPLWYAGRDFSQVRYFAVSGPALHEINEDGIPALLLDDFDDGDNVSMINAITGKSLWYVYTDQPHGGNTIMLPESVSNIFSRALTDSAAFSGKSVRTTTILGHAIKSPYAGIALVVEPHSATSVDLSAMQNFSFMLKGKGQIRVIFWSRLASTTYALSDVWGQFGAVVQCPATWTKTIIRPQDIITPEDSKQRADSLKWQDAADSVFRIEFSTWNDTLDTVGISLDQVYINGVTDSIFR